MLEGRPPLPTTSHIICASCGIPFAIKRIISECHTYYSYIFEIERRETGMSDILSVVTLQLKIHDKLQITTFITTSSTINRLLIVGTYTRCR